MARTRLCDRVAKPAMLVALACGGAMAMGQGPSFRQLAGEVDQDNEPTALSPNGRYVTGNHGLATVFRSDMLTGAHHLCAQTSTLYPHYTTPDVIDNGNVFANYSNGLAPRRVYRWTPETNALLVVERTSNTGVFDYLTSVSRDGLYAVGYIGDTLGNTSRPMLYDFSTNPPSLFEMSRFPDSPSDGYARLVGIAEPVNGQRLIYGNCSSAGSPHTSATWLLGFAAPMAGVVNQPLAALSARGEYLLFSSYGFSPFVRGGGADWALAAPAGMRGPMARGLSDDGRVVAGDAMIPDAQSTNVDRDMVIWRREQAPQTLRSILASAGVAVPSWIFSYGVDISADGSTVLGYYDISNTQPPFGLRGFVAVLPALNDNCGSARPVTYGTSIDSTNGATRAGGAVTCASEGVAPDVWFSFVPVANETVTIDTCGSSFDTTLAVYGGSCASLGNPLACNDDASPACSQLATNSRVSLGVFSGSTYLIRVSGWNGAYGSVQLNITAPARPANDTCVQATNMSPGSGWFWNNSGAITDARPNCPGAGTPFSDLWYRTTPNETGRMTYSTCGSTINTVMAVYPGSACGDVNIPAIACVNSNGACGSPGAYLTVPCVAGEQQLIRMGGMFGATGSGQITARFACDANVLNTYAVGVINHGARAYWRFEDSGVVTAADAVRADPFTCGNYPGTYTNATYRRRGAQGQALELRAGGHVQADTVPAARVGDTSLCAQTTLEAWVKTTDANAGVVMTNRNDPGQTSLTMVVGFNPIGVPNTAGKAMFVIDGPGIFFGAISTSRIDDGRWHHVVGRRIPRSFGVYTYYIYVDGLLEGTSNIGGGPADNNAPGGANWYIGNGPAWNSFIPGFNGSIDEAAIYCRALSPSEITGHYTTGRPCVADMDDGSGTGEPDGGVTIDDLLYYLGAFADGALTADIDDGSGSGRRDGGVTIDDLLYFLQHFADGC